MKLTVYLNFILLYFHLTKADVYNSRMQFISLIKWIRGYYSTSAVFFLHSPNINKYFDGLQIMQLSYIWSRLLGHEQIATLTSSFSNMHVVIKNCNRLRPLIVVFITKSEDLQEFSNNTKHLKMSSFAWFLIFLPTGMEQKRDNCYVPLENLFNLSFDTEMLVMCYGDPVLREWYSVDGTSTETFDLIKWYPEKQPLGASVAAIDKLTNLSLYERRNDLRGKVLRAVTVKNSLLITVKDNELKGYLSRVISELKNTLNFTLDIVAEVLEYGCFNLTTKRWNGALNLVATGEVDIGISDFSMTNIRLDFVDYTVPILTSRTYLYMKQPDSFAVKWFAYFKTFSLALWMSIIIIIVIAQFSLAFIRSRIESCSMSQVMLTEFFHIWAIICQQGVAEFPRYSPLRLGYFSILITGIVIFSAYSASLICFLTARIRDLSFTTIDEFINDGFHSVIAIRDSSDYDMFINSNDSFSANIRKVLKPYKALPLDMKSGFQSICADRRLAFYTSFSVESQQKLLDLHIPCKVIYLEIGRVDNLSLILSRKNQYTSVLNYYLQKLLNSGLLNRYKGRIYSSENTTFQPVGFNSVASVLIIFFCGVALALVILIAEICCGRQQFYRHDNRLYN